MKTSELEGAALNWAVAECRGVEVTHDRHNGWEHRNHHRHADLTTAELMHMLCARMKYSYTTVRPALRRQLMDLLEDDAMHAHNVRQPTGETT